MFPLPATKSYLRLKSVEGCRSLRRSTADRLKVRGCRDTMYWPLASLATPNTIASIERQIQTLDHIQYEEIS